MTLGEYLGAGSSITGLLCRMNWDANDASWNANNWTATNVTRNNGRIWSWLAMFNGTSSVISFTTANSLKPIWSFTASLWTKTTNTAVQVFFQSYSQVSSVAWFQVMTNASNIVRFVVWRNSWFVLWSWYQEAAWPVAVNDWNRHHICCVYNWVTITVYQDWVAGTGVSWTLWLAYKATSYQRIGCANRDGTNDSWMNGDIDEVILDLRAWSLADIRKYYTYAKGRFWI